jgi:hypothetical protein
MRTRFPTPVAAIKAALARTALKIPTWGIKDYLCAYGDWNLA